MLFMMQQMILLRSPTINSEAINRLEKQATDSGVLGKGEEWLKQIKTV